MVFLGVLAVIGTAGYVSGRIAYRPVEQWLNEFFGTVVRTVAAEGTVRATGAEADSWARAGSWELRGRAKMTVAYAPVQSGAEASALETRSTPSSSTS